MTMAWLHDAQYGLVLFTLFTQAAVGAFWVLLVNDFLKRNDPCTVQDAFTRVGVAILLPLTAVGLLMSLTHLGRPWIAFRALMNVRTSWLSREIWAFSLFFGLAALYAFFWWRRARDAELRRLVGVFTALAGGFGILCQAMVYQIPGRPMWDHPSTLVLFFASALILGPLTVATIYGFAWGRVIDRESGEETVRQSHRRLGITLVIAATLGAAGLAWRLQPFIVADAAAGADGRISGLAAWAEMTRLSGLWIGAATIREYPGLLLAHVVLGFGVPVVLAVGLRSLHRRGAQLIRCNLWITAALILVLAGEMAGRALFYLTGKPWF